MDEDGAPIVICLADGWELRVVESTRGARLREVHRATTGDPVRQHAPHLVGRYFTNLSELVEAFKREMR